MTVMHAIDFLWSRLDSPGHDACRFEASARACRWTGMAAFAESDLVCQLQYEVVASPAFRFRRAWVEGRVGPRAVRLSFESDRQSRWWVDGRERPALAGLIDLDLGFTPATNMLSIRRLGLAIGEHAEVQTVYLDIPSLRVQRLPQRYQRLTDTTYAYESPVHDYRAVLQVTAEGAVSAYPGVFALQRPA
jgi:hypothetical protein